MVGTFAIVGARERFGRVRVSGLPGLDFFHASNGLKLHSSRALLQIFSGEE